MLEIPSISTTSSPRANNFHAIRYILAASVLYSHSYGLLNLPEPIAFQKTMGTFAVQGFFALSGYLIAKSCVRIGHLGHYFTNRTLRIAPALIAALILGNYLLSIFAQFSKNPVPYIVNGPVWTLSWEVMCYTICGLLWRLGLLVPSSLGSILATAWIIFVITPTNGDTTLVIAPLFLLFFTGSYISLKENELNFRTTGLISVLILTLLAVDSSSIAIKTILEHIPFLYGPNIPTGRHYLIAYLVCLPFSLVWLARYVDLKLSVNNDYSYGLYIFGWPVQQVAIASYPQISPLALFLVSLSVTHAIAMLSWHLIEKRALRLKF